MNRNLYFKQCHFIYLTHFVQEMDKEIENYRSIMKGLLQAEVDATEKIKEDIKVTEKIKFELEDDVNNAMKQLNTLKAEEVKAP